MGVSLKANDKEVKMWVYKLANGNFLKVVEEYNANGEMINHKETEAQSINDFLIK